MIGGGGECCTLLGVYRSEDNCEHSLSFHHKDSRALTSTLESKHLYPLAISLAPLNCKRVCYLIYSCMYMCVYNCRCGHVEQALFLRYLTGLEFAKHTRVAGG